MKRDDLAARLLETFVGEVEEQVRAMNAELLALEASPGDRERIHALFRVAHTLKGAAGAAEVPVVEQTCHALESLLGQARSGERVLGPADFQLLFSAADALSDAASRLQARQTLVGSPIAVLHETLQSGARSAQTRKVAGTIERNGGKKAEKDAVPAGRNVDKEPPTGAPAGDGLVRVRADTLDSLLASGSDLLVASGRLGIRAAELDALHAALAHCVNRWRQESRDLRHALQRAGQGVAEPRILGLEEDLHHLERDSARLAAAARADGRVLTRSVDEVLGHARRIRMRPVAEAWETLPRTVRDLSSAAGKEVILQLSGGEVEADRAVLDGLREALIQLVRNAVDHGIEPPERRTAAGKPRKGTLRVGAELRGDRLIVTVADDGAGLDAGAVRAELERRGISPPSDDADLIQALADARVSTRAEATALSGRGVGLDVVRAAAARIGGRLEARWAQGRGTTFTLECPVTLASARALLVSVASQFVAIPVTAVQRAQRIPRSELRSLEGRTVVQTPEGPLPLIPLGRILAPLGERPWGEFVPVVVLRVGARRLAVSVDELLEVRDLAIRPVRAGRAPLPVRLLNRHPSRCMGVAVGL